VYRRIFDLEREGGVDPRAGGRSCSLASLFLNTEEIIYHNQHMLHYQVMINILEVVDWHEPSDLSSSSDDSDSDDPLAFTSIPNCSSGPSARSSPTWWKTMALLPVTIASVAHAQSYCL
jgi:hypothetical protein